MEFRVPQFIEHDPKLLGPFTLRQSIFVGMAFGGALILYPFMAKNYFFFYVLACAAMFGAAIALAFVKVEGQNIPVVGKNFANFSMNAKMYIWKRKESPVFLSIKTERSMEKTDNLGKKSPLKMKQQGKIEDLMKKIEFEKQD
jgi:hypothetical protein